MRFFLHEVDNSHDLVIGKKLSSERVELAFQLYSLKYFLA